MWELKKHFGNTAFVDDRGRSMTYRELKDMVERIGEVIPKRSLVFAFCTNTIGSAAGYIAFTENKIVPLLLRNDLETELRDYLIRIYKPQYVYIPMEMEDAFTAWKVVYRDLGYVLLKTGSKVYEKICPELALLLTTSGSIGSPKLVRQSYRNLEANTDSIIEYLHLSSEEKAITTLPMSYTYGLSIINTHIKSGAAVCLTELSVVRGEFWEFFEREGATSFAGVPYTYEMLNKMKFTQRKLPSLHYMTQAGGRLSPELHREFAEYAMENGKQFIVMYGQTEATARMAYLPGEKAIEKYGSTGIAIPGGTIWLRNDNGGKITEAGEVGELIYEGENVTLGYAESLKDLALGDERHGVLETGDMAKFDEDGYLYIVGRKNRFLKIYGNRINLDETERMIKKGFPDEDIACGGTDEQLKVYVISKDEVVRKKIRQLLINKTGLNPRAFEIVPVNVIPRNDAGKVQYKLLEKR